MSILTCVLIARLLCIQIPVCLGIFNFRRRNFRVGHKILCVFVGHFEDEVYINKEVFRLAIFISMDVGLYEIWIRSNYEEDEKCEAKI